MSGYNWLLKWKVCAVRKTPDSMRNYIRKSVNWFTSAINYSADIYASGCVRPSQLEFDVPVTCLIECLSERLELLISGCCDL